MRELEIVSDEDRFYVFEDVAGLFWPRDYDHDNHEAEDRIKMRMREKGHGGVVGRRGYYVQYSTPSGPVEFDSEGASFECHATERGPVEYVVGVIRELLDERAEHRRALQ